MCYFLVHSDTFWINNQDTKSTTDHFKYLDRVKSFQGGKKSCFHMTNLKTEGFNFIFQPSSTITAQLKSKRLFENKIRRMKFMNLKCRTISLGYQTSVEMWQAAFFHLQMANVLMN